MIWSCLRGATLNLASPHVVRAAATRDPLGRRSLSPAARRGGGRRRVVAWRSGKNAQSHAQVMLEIIGDISKYIRVDSKKNLFSIDAYWWTWQN